MATARPRRRWYQFSIVSLLILTMVVALLVARFAVPARRQHDAVKRITELGAEVLYDYQESGAQNPPGPAWLRKLIGDDFFQRVQSVSLSNDRFNSPEEVYAAIVQIRRLPTIHSLYISSPGGLNDLTVSEIARLDSLKFLSIHHVSLTAEGLAQLARLSNLSWLRLSGAFDEAGLASFARLEKLAYLDLWNIDDRTLLRVAELSHLKRIVIVGFTSSDSTGLAKLSKLDHLTDLKIEPLTDMNLKQIASLRHLQKLEMRGSISPDAIVGLAPLSKLEELIYNRSRAAETLSAKTDLIYSESSISDLLGYFENKYGVKFQFDNEATVLLHGDSAAPLLTATDKSISLHDALDKLLTPHGLGYKVESSNLVITTRAEAERARAGIKKLQEKLPKLKVIGW